jgi:membrane-associated phospholipid phosphatase
MSGADRPALSVLGLSGLGLALLVRGIKRRQTDSFDQLWAARVGTGQGGGDHLSRLAQPRNGLFETLLIASLPRLRLQQRAEILAAPVLAGLLGHALKLLVPRERPGKARFSPEGDQSFPSTHAAHAAALSFAVARVARDHGSGRWTPAAAAAVTCLIALARLRASAHWPTDVAAGALAGIAAAQVARLGCVSAVGRNR